MLSGGAITGSSGERRVASYGNSVVGGWGSLERLDQQVNVDHRSTLSADGWMKAWCASKYLPSMGSRGRR